MIYLRSTYPFWVLLIAGAIFPLSLSPVNWWPVGIVSISLLSALLFQQSPKHLFIKACVYGFGLFITGVSWIYISLHEHGYMPVLLAAVATALFCLFLAAFFALPFLLCSLIPQSTTAWILGFPSVWLLSEWLRSWLFTGFPWLFAGYMHTETWLSGWAPIGGVLLLSLFSAFTATFLQQLIRQPKRTLNNALCGSLVISIFLAGYFLRQVTWTEAKNKQLSTVLIQPNIELEIKWSSGKLGEVLEQLAEQTSAYWDTDLIIWPESAIPAIPQQVNSYLNGIHQFALEQEAALLTGIPTFDSATRSYYNSMLALGNAQGQYDKTRLVPFGEYVPMESMLRGLIRFFDLPMSSFSLGAPAQPLLQAKGEKIATAICYEIVYPNLVADIAREASMILTVSNDIWFGNSIGPQQHMQMAQMRALENSKPMIRATNSGISALVDHHGTIYRQIDQFTRAELQGVVTPREGKTPFSQTGSRPIVIFCFICCLLLINRARAERKLR